MKAVVRNLFYNLETRVPLSSLDLLDSGFVLCHYYKLGSLILETQEERVYRCTSQRRSPGSCVIRICSRRGLEFNSLRGVSVPDDAFCSFVANDIEGVQRLVDYLEDDDCVYLVYSAPCEYSLRQFIAENYARQVSVNSETQSYESVILRLFRGVSTTVIELFNHGVHLKNLTVENIALDTQLLPVLVNSRFSRVKDEEKEWLSLMKTIGLFLFELWIGHSLSPSETGDLDFFLASNDDIDIPENIAGFLRVTIHGKIGRTSFMESLENLENPEKL